MATLTQTKDTIFSKGGLIIIAGLLIYFLGGFRLIRNNPSIILFIVLGIILIYTMGGGKK